MDIKQKILEVLENSKNPMKAVQIAEATGLDQTAVSKAMQELKKEGKIVSPKACFYTLA